MKSYTQVEGAEYIGTSKQQMYRFTKSGRIKLRPDGKIDKSELDDFLDQKKGKTSNAKSTNGEDSGDSEKLKLWDEQARLAKHKADIAEMESQKMSGQLVEIDVVTAEFGKFAFAIRQRLLGMGARLAPQLAKKPPAFIKSKIDSDVEECLNDLTKYSTETGRCEAPKPARKVTKRRAKNGAKAKANRKPVGKQK